MQEHPKKPENRPAAVVSWLYLTIAAAALVLTLKTCVPAAGALYDRAMQAVQQTKTVQAFSELTDRLQQGQPVQEAMSGSFEILTSAGD